jgi:hypothetical protein
MKCYNQKKLEIKPNLKIIVSIRESRDEQTKLLRLLVTNSNRDGTVVGNARDQS